MLKKTLSEIDHPLRILVVGAGGVGGYFGGKLAAAGQLVSFVARGPHGDAISTTGLKIESIDGDFTTGPLPVLSLDVKTEIHFDIILVTVKAWDVPYVASRLAQFVGPDTLVVPLQNGIEASQIIAEHISSGSVGAGLCYGSFHGAGPGLIKHTGVPPKIIFGELTNAVSPRVQRLLAAFAQSAIAAEVAPDIQSAIWQKFTTMAPWSTVGALTRSTIGQIRTCKESWELLKAAISEVIHVAKASKVVMPQNLLNEKLTFFQSIEASNIASMQRDLYAGRPFEFEAQTGALVRQARKVGVQCPFHEMAYAALLPQFLAVASPNRAKI